MLESGTTIDLVSTVLLSEYRLFLILLSPASTPNMALTSHGTCQLPGCTRPKYCDPANGRVHDWCGRGHAYQARIQGTCEQWYYIVHVVIA